MDRELQEKKLEGNRSEADRLLSTILYFSLAGILFFMVDLYMIIALPNLLPAIIIAAVAVLACGYLALATLVKRTRMKEAEQAEQLAGISKSEKASYLLIRRYFDDLEQQMSLLEERLNEPFQEVVAAQKAAAKVVINRNKENISAVLNANEKLMDVLMQVDSKMEDLSDMFTANTAAPKENASELLEKQTEQLRQSASDIVAECTDEILSQISVQLRDMNTELKDELQKELQQAVEQLSALPPQVIMNTVPAAVSSQPASAEVSDGQADSILPALEPMSETAAMPTAERSAHRVSDEAALDSLLSGAIGAVLPESGSATASETIAVDFVSDLDSSDFELEEQSELADLPELDTFEEFPSESEETSGLGALDDMELDPLPDLFTEVTLDAPMPAPAEEPFQFTEESLQQDLSERFTEEQQDLSASMETESVGEVPPMPDLSDPNKMMSPDDIAAILASVNAEAESLQPEPQIVADEVIEENPLDPLAPLETEIVKDIPPMPDLSDPNKMMSPDDIAALFANLG